MQFEEEEKRLRKRLRNEGLQLKNLSASDTLNFIAEYWRSTSIEGVASEHGDGFVVFFELLNEGRSTSYEFGINRIARFPQASNAKFWEWVPAYKICTRIKFKPTREILSLNPSFSVFSCWDKAALPHFISELKKSVHFRLLQNQQPTSFRLNSFACMGPPYHPNHPTLGLRWATS